MFKIKLKLQFQNLLMSYAYSVLIKIQYNDHNFINFYANEPTSSKLLHGVSLQEKVSEFQNLIL